MYQREARKGTMSDPRKRERLLDCIKAAMENTKQMEGGLKAKHPTEMSLREMQIFII